MNRSSAAWVLASVAAALGAFAVVRAVAPPLNSSASAPAATGAGTALVRTSAQLDAALAAADQGDDALMRRLRFLELVERAEPGELRRMFLSAQTSRREKRAIAQRWAETDAPGMFEFLKSVSITDWERDGEQHDAVRGILFRTWAQQDPEEAMAAAGALSHRRQFRTAQWEIVQSLFASDPVKAFALSAGMPRNYGGDRLTDSIWQDDPAGFLKLAGDAPKGALRGQIRAAADNAFAAWVKKDPAAATEWLKSRPADQRRSLWSAMSFRMAEVDPTTAQAWFSSLPASAEREEAGSQIVNAWAKKDARAALEWLQDNLQGGRTQAFAHVAEALASQGIDSAKQLLEAMPPGSQRDTVVSTIANTWASKDFKPALDWVLSLPPDDPGRRQALRNIGYQWPEKDLAGAAAFVLANEGRGDARDMMWNVSGQFFEKDLQAGVAWAAALPENAGNEAFDAFFRSAAASNKWPQTFSALESLPLSQQNTLIERFASQIMGDPFIGQEDTTRSLTGLKHIPPDLRDTARRAIEKSEQGTPERKKAALEALK